MKRFFEILGWLFFLVLAIPMFPIGALTFSIWFGFRAGWEYVDTRIADRAIDRIAERRKREAKL